jgi:hypothetical protein
MTSENIGLFPVKQEVAPVKIIEFTYRSLYTVRIRKQIASDISAWFRDRFGNMGCIEELPSEEWTML